MRLVCSLLAMVLVAVVALAGCNSSETKGNRASGVGSSNAVPYPSNPAAHVAPSDGVKRVTTGELRDALDKGTAIVIDVRAASVYQQNHIKGSINIPLDQVEARLNDLPRDKMIVTYCS